MNRTLILALFAVPVAALAGSGSPLPSTVSQTPTAANLKDFYLRSVPDDDPSEYIGAFVMDSSLTPDENNATKTRCSSFVSYKMVGTGDVVTTNYFKSSVGGALKFGIPPIAFGKASADAEATLLVNYTAKQKWQAKVADPGGFEDCCANYPGSCAKYYIGDFTTGTGKVYYSTGLDAKGDVSVFTPAGAGTAAAYGGKQWSFARELPNEVAFAFQLKLSPLKEGLQASDPMCNSNWKQNCPQDGRGQWFCTVSDVMQDEAGVRANVVDKANVAVATWCESTVSSSRSGGRTDSGTGIGLKSDIGASSTWDAASTAAVRRLREVCTDVETAGTPRGTDYKAYGAYLLPSAEVKDTCGDLLKAKGGGTMGAP